MIKILWNWCCIVAFPLLAGILVRWLLRRKARAWIFTAAAAVLAVALVLWTRTNPIPGSEGPALMALQALCLTLGAGMTGLILRLTPSRS